VSWAQLGYWNPETRAYEYREFDKQPEVVSFQGNASLKDNKPFLHIHGAFGRRDFSVIGGHVKEARAQPTFAIWLSTEDVPVVRTRDAQTGLDLLDLLRGNQ
jgi:uncharacterized protein